MDTFRDPKALKNSKDTLKNSQKSFKKDVFPSKRIAQKEGESPWFDPKCSKVLLRCVCVATWSGSPTSTSGKLSSQLWNMTSGRPLNVGWDGLNGSFVISCQLVSINRSHPSKDLFPSNWKRRGYFFHNPKLGVLVLSVLTPPLCWVRLPKWFFIWAPPPSPPT